jgi:hypothetical protein
VLTRQALEDVNRRFVAVQNRFEGKQNEPVSVQALVNQRTEALEKLRLARVGAGQEVAEVKKIELSPDV